MSWVDTIAEDDADGLLGEIYDTTREQAGHVINLVKIQSLRPETMSIGRDLYRHLMDGPGELSKLERVLVATVVSRLNECFY